MKTKKDSPCDLVQPCSLLCTFGLAQARTKDEKKTISQVVDSAATRLERDFVPAAEAMPEDKYSFAPTNGEFKGVRTFAEADQA